MPVYSNMSQGAVVIKTAVVFAPIRYVNQDDYTNRTFIWQLRVGLPGNYHPFLRSEKEQQAYRIYDHPKYLKKKLYLQCICKSLGRPSSKHFLRYLRNFSNVIPGFQSTKGRKLAIDM